MTKDNYSIYVQEWGNIHIHKNPKTEINIAVVVPVESNGQYTTSHTRKQAMKIAKKIVKCLNGVENE